MGEVSSALVLECLVHIPVFLVPIGANSLTFFIGQEVYVLIVPTLLC